MSVSKPEHNISGNATNVEANDSIGEDFAGLAKGNQETVSTSIKNITIYDIAKKFVLNNDEDHALDLVLRALPLVFITVARMDRQQPAEDSVEATTSVAKPQSRKLKVNKKKMTRVVIH